MANPENHPSCNNPTGSTCAAYNLYGIHACNNETDGRCSYLGK